MLLTVISMWKKKKEAGSRSSYG